MIDHPNYYTQARTECINIIEDLELNFNLGCAMKYLWRFGTTNNLNDLHKARWYVDREIQRRNTIGNQP